MKEIETIKNAVSNYFGINPEDLKSKDRHTLVRMARQIIIKIASEETVLNPELITSEVGLTRPNYYWSINSVNNQIETDIRFRNMYNRIVEYIQ